MNQTLTDLYKNSNSLDVLASVNKQIADVDRTSIHCHNFTSILYDIRTMLGEDEKTYLEIGTMSGASAGLVLQNKYKTNVFCVDPCIGRIQDKYNKIINNLKHVNVYDNSIHVFKNYSQDNDLLDKLKHENFKTDMLFIDGDHSYDAVVRDFHNYKNFVNSQGYIIFDDYYDAKYSPDVRKAVDFLVKNIDPDEFEIIGTLENSHNIEGKNRFT